MGLMWNDIISGHEIRRDIKPWISLNIKSLNFNLPGENIESGLQSGITASTSNKLFHGYIHIYSIDKTNKVIKYVLWVGPKDAEPTKHIDGREWWDVRV